MQKVNKQHNKMIIFIFLSAFMIFVTAFFSFQIFSRALETVTKKNQIIYTEITNQIRAIAQSTVAISNLDIAKNLDLSIQERARALKPFQEESGLLLIGVTDEFGNRASSLSNNVINLSDREYFQEVKRTRKTVVSEVITSRTTGEENIVIIHPIIIDNEFKGTIYSAILLDTLIDLVTANSNFANGYESYIVDERLNSFVVAPQNQPYLKLNRLLETAQAPNFYYPSSKGIYVVSAQTELFTGWKIVTELNTFLYYDELWLFMLIVIPLSLFALIVMISQLSKQHRRQMIPLIEKLNRDDLTKVANRSYFEYEVKQWLAVYRSGAFVIMDLDNFKQVNDVLGHRAGDALLIDTAKQLEAIFRKEDIVARLGGDEFVVFLPDLTAINAIELRVTEVLKKVPRTYKHADGVIHVTMSIGIVIVDETFSEYEEVYERADQALYEVKKLGKNGAMIRSGSESFYLQV
ncbi:MAG: diguanylate cyclase domain-containing protein [Culicoidibacterales bacterium]